MPLVCGFQCLLLLLGFGVIVHMPVLCSFSMWVSSDSVWVIKLSERFSPLCYILPDYTQLSHLHVVLPKPLT